ncbi:MAG: gliding motility-associated ABC transporter substrate-binding protein GldG [Prolixibacteraceae bacterium]|jgi:ABC-2 type transport system permease protein|nr:gliding motility-associated ABC transporter substrate-binding protein GldG [Prolixibacteraceae bacterium]
MYSLLKKELNSFFGSITGYLVVSIFLLTTSLFLWVIPGNFNLFEGQRASLKGFFELAPWLYLFLIPAITMRLFAEEKKMGTLEMIVTRPIAAFGIVSAKFFAALILVAISLLPTLLYFLSIYQLGNPVGNIDTGATWGSFLGLLLLASVYIGIGLFASVLTSNQVISFLIAIVLSYVLYLGLDFVASVGFSIGLQNFFLKLSLNEHYLSISRGVIDSRDLLYFIATTLFFLYTSRQFILKRRLIKQFKITNIVVIVAFWVLAVWLVNERFFRVDLTSENKYSLAESTKELLKEQDQPISIEVYLAGDLPAGMKEFQNAIVEKIEDMNAYSNKRIFQKTFDVYNISSETEQKNTIDNLIKSGIQPVNFGHKTTEGLSTKQIFPGVIVQGFKNGIALNLLKNNPLLSADENLQQSIELLEYEFVRALRYLKTATKPQLAFLYGQGEANEYETGDIRYSLSENYNVVNCNTSELIASDSIQTLVIAAPTKAFSEQDKLYIDQFIMKGGKVLWCVDPVNVSIDSLSKGYSTIAFNQGLNLSDQLFKYGVRMNSNLLQDAFCMEYPINTAPVGQATSFTPAPFYYSPLALPNPSHSLSRNLNNVMLEFTSSISILKNEKNKASTILATSPYARSIQTPVEVSLMSATNPPDQRLFNQANIPIGVLIEGEFESVFKNRMTQHLGVKNIRSLSKKNKMIVIADGDIIKNKVRNRNGQIQLQPLGFDQYSGQTFGNREFILNCIDYLNDDEGIMQLRSKIVKLRMLDKVKIREEKLKWQLINTVIPILFFIILGLVFNFIRRKRYS